MTEQQLIAALCLRDGRTSAGDPAAQGGQTPQASAPSQAFSAGGLVAKALLDFEQEAWKVGRTPRLMR